MFLLSENQIPKKIRNPTSDWERGYNACIAECWRIMKSESAYQIIIRKNEV